MTQYTDPSTISELAKPGRSRQTTARARDSSFRELLPLDAVENCAGFVFPEAVGACLSFVSDEFAHAILREFGDLVVRQPLSPLFEEKRDADSGTEVACRACPIWMHGARVSAGFTAANDPVECGDAR